MRNDFAALIPPFVVAAAFIAAVVALLRREMAPRRRRRAGEDSSADMPGTDHSLPSAGPQPRRPDQPGDDTTGADSSIPRTGRTDGRTSGTVAEDGPHWR